MKINNNLNSMVQLEKELQETSESIVKLSTPSNISEEDTLSDDTSDINFTDELVKQIEIPISYSANANVISVQNAVQDTILDIKA